MGILIYIFAVQDVLDVQLLDLSPFIGNAMIEKYLRFCAGREPASNANGFRNSHVVAEIILARFAHLPQSNKDWLLEVPEIHVNNGIVQRLGIGLLERLDH